MTASRSWLPWSYLLHSEALRRRAADEEPDAPAEEPPGKSLMERCLAPDQGNSHCNMQGCSRFCLRRHWPHLGVLADDRSAVQPLDGRTSCT